MNHKNPLGKAILICGLKPLAAAIGISYQAIQKFELSGVPAERVIPIASATRWEVTPHDLRPDLYPNKQDGMPPDLRSAA